MTDAQTSTLIIGKVLGAFGVKGWVKIQSYTEDPSAIIKYQPWQLVKHSQQLAIKCQKIQQHSKGLVALLADISDRDAAQALAGYEIQIQRDQLPVLAEDDYYWSDLEGLTVITVDGKVLGKVDHLLETGANDVMVVKGERERWIPWLMDRVIKQVDLAGQQIQVDWDPDF